MTRARFLRRAAVAGATAAALLGSAACGTVFQRYFVRGSNEGADKA